jgi:hypothetical protein
MKALSIFDKVFAVVFVVTVVVCIYYISTLVYFWGNEHPELPLLVSFVVDFFRKALVICAISIALDVPGDSLSSSSVELCFFEDQIRIVLNILFPDSKSVRLFFFFLSLPFVFIVHLFFFLFGPVFRYVFTGYCKENSKI